VSLAPGSRAGAKDTVLTALDYIEIQQLVNRYAFAIDTCSSNGYDYADLYTPDGIFYWGVGSRKSVGREQLAEAAGGGKNGCKKLERATRDNPIATHTTVNLIIEPSPEGATGKSYLVYPGVTGTHADSTHDGHVGGYQDVYVKTAKGWRFKSRLHVFPPDVPGTIDIAKMYGPDAVAARQNAAPAPRPNMMLTALDYYQIQQLVSKYAEAIDTCSNSGYDYADLFTADGFFAPFTNGQIGRKAQGREALAVVSGGGAKGCTGAGWIRQGVKHLYVNHIIDPTPDGAKGQVNMLMIGLGGDPNKILHDGYYEDSYEKTPQGWKFKSRIHHANFVAAAPGAGAQK
jgi:hypothetical protein